jgi:hypothetical protein
MLFTNTLLGLALVKAIANLSKDKKDGSNSLLGLPT